MATNDPLSPPFRVLIVDDHRIIGELLANRLVADHQIRVLGIGNNISSAVHFIRQQSVDIALVDMEIGEKCGIEASRQLLEINPNLRIIGLSAHFESHYPISLLEAGGRGFISKRSSATDIVDAIRRVARGDLAISPDVALHLATQVRETGPVKRLSLLTGKETEVLQLLAVGHSVDEISAHLNISVKTVQSHRANMKKKLSLTTDVELCLLALRAGIIRVHDGKSPAPES